MSAFRPIMAELPQPKGQQKEVLAMPGQGHFVILGTAGSGKTVMAIHRAAHLAHPKHSNTGRVLLVTFNRSLIAYMARWQPPALDNVDFRNYHHFARGYLGARGLMGPRSICDTDAKREAYVAEAVAAVHAAHPGEAEAFFARPTLWFADEIKFIDNYGLTTVDDYVASERYGRGVGFARELRPLMLEIHAAYAQARAADGFDYDWEDQARVVNATLRADETPRLYRHIVIDEGQDFSPEMLRSLVAAVPPDGSVTLFADMAQQIYGRQLSWKQAGLDLTADPWPFKRNYRNTPEIATLGLAISKMPYFKDVADMVEPDEFEPSGPRPSLVECASWQEQFDFVVEYAKSAARTGSVGVLMRRTSDVQRFARTFRGGQRLDRHMSAWDPGPGISWGTVHSAKGFEFSTVILVGLSDDLWPEPQAVAHDGEEIATASEGRLLYVGVTRAGRELIMTYVGEPTSLLPENTGLWQDQRV